MAKSLIARDAYDQAIADLQRALIIADQACRCVKRLDAWTNQETIENHAAIKDLIHDYGTGQ